MAERYPGYDVMAKRGTASWNDKTRRVIDERLALPRTPRFFEPLEWRTLEAICARITPQQADRAPVPVASMIEAPLLADQGDGYRNARLPPAPECWRRGLRALDAEARAAHGVAFAELGAGQQDTLLTAAQAGALKDPAWGDIPCALFFSDRLLGDIVGAYYAHPAAWSEIGFGGPASPRGYVRLDIGRRDPWEAVEARPGQEAQTWRENRRVR